MPSRGPDAYELPRELIAQSPEPRGREFARLLVVSREKGDWRETRFGSIPDCLRPGDVLVLNDTRVSPARALGRKPGGGEAELLFLARIGDPAPDQGEDWKALIRPARRLRAGLILNLGAKAQARLTAKEGAEWRLRVEAPGGLREWLENHGLAPLPPYIKRKGRERSAQDREDYQTVYAREEGSVAAPTAGLHFTPGLLQEIRSRGVEVGFLTLRLSHFEFVRTSENGGGEPPPEDYELKAETAEKIAAARSRGGRIFAVGTTTVRALESNFREFGAVRAARGKAAIYIRPGHRFGAVDALVTNFHLPGTSMLDLVSAFGGKELVLAAYRHAVRERFRFLSLGDAMLIL